MSKSTYDSKCAELAEAFLADEPFLNTKERRHELATAIQQAIEDCIDDMRRNFDLGER